MSRLRFLILAAGLLGLAGLCGPLPAEPALSIPGPVPAPIHLGSIPTPAMPSALITTPSSHTGHATIVVPPLPLSYQLPGCPGDCRTSNEKKVCVSQEEFKKHPVYTTREVEYCVPKHGLFGSKGSECGEVRTKTVLVKKMVPDEKPHKKCVVQTVQEPLPATPIAPPPIAPAPLSPVAVAPSCATCTIPALPILSGPFLPVPQPGRLPEMLPEKTLEKTEKAKD